MLVTSFITKRGKIVKTLGSNRIDKALTQEYEDYLSPLLNSHFDSHMHFDLLDAELPDNRKIKIQIYTLSGEQRALVSFIYYRSNIELREQMSELRSQKECYGNLLTTTLKDSLSVIDGYIQLMRDGKSDLQTAAGPIESEISKILENCDLIDCLAKIEKNRDLPSRTGDDLRTLFDYILIELNPLIQAKKLGIRVENHGEWKHGYDIQLFKKAFEIILKDIVSSVSDRKRIKIIIEDDAVEIESCCEEKCRKRMLALHSDPMKDLSNPYDALKIFVTRKVFDLHGFVYEISPFRKGVKHRIQTK